jgi:hypothetical protein
MLRTRGGGKNCPWEGSPRRPEPLTARAMWVGCSGLVRSPTTAWPCLGLPWGSLLHVMAPFVLRVSLQLFDSFALGFRPPEVHGVAIHLRWQWCSPVARATCVVFVSSACVMPSRRVRMATCKVVWQPGGSIALQYAPSMHSSVHPSVHPSMHSSVHSSMHSSSCGLDRISFRNNLLISPYSVRGCCVGC